MVCVQVKRDFVVNDFQFLKFGTIAKVWKEEKEMNSQLAVICFLSIEVFKSTEWPLSSVLKLIIR